MSGTSTELLRVSCAPCGYTIRMAIWCRDPQCCDQDLVSFLDALAAGEQQDGVPAYATRFTEDTGEYSPDLLVRVWAARSIVPIFGGQLREAQRFVMRHVCRDAAGAAR